MSVEVMSIRGSKFASSNPRTKRSSVQSFARLTSLDYQDEMMDAYGGSYNYDYGMSIHHESIQTMAQQTSAAFSEEESESNLSMLMNAFPEVDPLVVQDVFIAKNYDICGTAEILSGLLPATTGAEVTVATTGNSDTEGDDDDEWSFHDADDDISSVASVDWVVVQEEWNDDESKNVKSFGRSYSDVLLAPHSGHRQPFQSLAAPQPAAPSSLNSSSTKTSKVAAEDHQQSLSDDYYGIKEYGERARLGRRPSSHPKAKANSGKAAAAK
ncbi:hypothetical protein DYB32_003541 [Aphanomyces invadans]|uniref:CUE domain-containing protein n=1 Tax=Aphanomyces invadans TaxID=157072 RepID=A0A418B6B0_9STRA|nr:hypothetical protein DYB32_003541 [Aphanomyces invadans]